jgi:hypothetical protein
MSITRFYDLEARKLKADGEKIALFTDHPVALGTYRESRLCEYIAEHVPMRFEVTGGFVSLHNPDKDNIQDFASKQIDCLVHEVDEYAPLLKSVGFSVVVPQAVASVIEVKSDLTLFRKGSPDGLWEKEGGRYSWAGTLIDALSNIKSAIDILKLAEVPRDHYFAGIIAYEGSSINQLVGAMKSGEIFKQLDVTDVDQLPDSICVVDGPWFAFSSLPWEDSSDLYGLGEHDESWSYALTSERINEGGSLQQFTALLSFVLMEGRRGHRHNVGGLRSGKGYPGVIENHKIDVSSSRFHSEFSRSPEENGGDAEPNVT